MVALLCSVSVATTSTSY